MSGTTAAVKEQDFSYLFFWKCRVCNRKTRGYLDYCETIGCGATRWWAGGVSREVHLAAR